MFFFQGLVTTMMFGIYRYIFIDMTYIYIVGLVNSKILPRICHIKHDILRKWYVLWCLMKFWMSPKAHFPLDEVGP